MANLSSIGRDGVSSQDPATEDSFYVKMGGDVLGPYSSADLRKLPGFMLQTPVKLAGSDEWSPAFTLINLKTYINPVTHSTDPNILTDLFSESSKSPEPSVLNNGSKRFIKKVLPITLLGVLGILVAHHLQANGRIHLSKNWDNYQNILKGQCHKRVVRTIQRLQRFDEHWLVEKVAPQAPALPLPAPIVLAPVPKPPALVIKPVIRHRHLRLKKKSPIHPHPHIPETPPVIEVD